tara:strand:+ start:13209 stop:13664 length:456 start_codon:yes stop_codon:yes gene_type:complete
MSDKRLNMENMLLFRSFFKLSTRSQSLPSLGLALGYGWFLLAGTGCRYDVLHLPDDSELECDSSEVVSYAQDIAPLLDLRCNGCHSQNAPSAGLDLTSYENAALYATVGNLLERVYLPVDDPSFMPKNRAPLEDCELGKLQRWTDNGAPNN